MAQNNRFFPLIIEGDSQILINMINSILQGTSAHKVGSSWRLAERLEQIEQWLLTHHAATISHTRQNGNKAIDLLANIGIKSGNILHVGTLSTIDNSYRLQEFNDLVQKESVNAEETHLNAGINNAI